MPIKYIPYYPEPIKGQALLNSFTRTRRALTYRDNDKPAQRILRGMPLYEVDIVEQIGEDPSGNLLIRGECVSACAYLKEQGITVDLVYIDPPFNSGANYAKRVYLRQNPKVAEAIAVAEAEMDDESLRAFEETMYGDIWTKEAYLNWMYENLLAIKSVMSASASIYVHLDWHIGHYVKILMDEVFGEDNFINEIVWAYFGFKRSTARKFPQKHDTLFFYAKDSDDYVWHTQYRPHSKAYLSRFKQDGQGKLYRDDVNPTGGGTRVIYVKEEGDVVESVWSDIPPVNPVAAERAEYATQKPEALLRRIIQASSNPGMVVADFFGGSGVTAKVAHDSERAFIHVDVGINSIQTARDRLKGAGASFRILEVRDGVALFRNPAQTMEKLTGLIPGLGESKELNEFWAGGIQDSKHGLLPVYLPNLLDHRARLLDLVELNRIVNEQIPLLPETIRRVHVYYVDMEDEKQLRDFLKEYGSPLVEVELLDLKSILHEVALNDEVDYTLIPAQVGWTLEITRFYSDRLRQKIDAHNQRLQLNAKKRILRQTTIDDAAADDDGEAPVVSIWLEISDDGLELIELLSLDCTATDGVWHSDAEVKIDKKGYVIRDGVKTKEFWHGKISSTKKPLRLKVRNIAGDETVMTLA